MHSRARKVPAVLFTAHAAASDEANADESESESERGRAARFSGVIRKPFA